ncbi:MAG: MFS transporter [Ferruginibacter sp.]|nr:MFS transporter [Cytophagales bacterium]
MKNPEVLPLNPLDTVAAKIGNYRWRICALLFFATTINYVDRQVLSLVLIDDGFRGEIPLTKEQIGYIDAAFKVAYALGFIIVGNFIDRVGTRKGFAFALVVWSLAAISHALARSPLGFGLARFGLGLGESGNFPGAVKTVAEWFPKKERSFATGLFNSGANIGAIIAPLTVPFIAINYGWRWAFILTGAVGFLWLIFWLRTYRRPEEHPHLSKAELSYIQSDPAEPTTRLPWISLFPKRQTWAVIAGKFFTDPIWWFYLTWLPIFFNDNQNLDEKLNLRTIGIPFLVIYLVSDLGSIAGGWLSTYFIKRGWSVNRARKTTMLICGLCVVPIFFASITSSLWVAIGLIALATAGHQGWSANVYTLSSDMFPKQAVGSVIGIGGLAGAVSGTLLAAASGLIIQSAGYLPLFIIASSAYLVALAVIHFLVPKLEPVQM